MVAKIFGSAVAGVNANIITVEVSIEQRTSFLMEGLPEATAKESQQLVESALKYFGYKLPQQKAVINFATVDIQNVGTAYDLPIAIGILQASAQVEFPELRDYVIMGELSPNGNLNPIKGVLPIAIEARKKGFKGFILPVENAKEASIVNSLDIIGVETIQQATDFLLDELQIDPLVTDTREIFYHSVEDIEVDFADVQGQENIKRAMEIAAAGGHNMIMIGPPEAGKTILAKCFPYILPPLTLVEALETTKIHSVAGKLGKNDSLLANRPFRSLHHSISDVGLVGGGGNPQPGEISLAHNGVLFLDELPEFRRSALEVMSKQLKERSVTISTAKVSVDFPANFMLVTSMNPCPCGYYNHAEKECVCGPGIVQHYLNKVSGPLLDQIDLHVEVTPVKSDRMTSSKKVESSKEIRERVILGRERQKKRFKDNLEVFCNAMMPSHVVKQICRINGAEKMLLKTAMERLGLPASAYDRILKVARTIADISGNEEIKAEHLAEAIQYRSLDREGRTERSQAAR